MPIKPATNQVLFPRDTTNNWCIFYHSLKLSSSFAELSKWYNYLLKSITLIIISIVLVLGVLVSSIGATSIEELPHSFKGYELYSWSEYSQWHFTLITGTNRNKTIEEITSEGDSLSETGWVRIQVVGADAIKDVLSRLPEGESVFWCDELHIGQSTETDLQLPPEQIAGAIEKYAKQCGLDFVVAVQSY